MYVNIVVRCSYCQKLIIILLTWEFQILNTVYSSCNQHYNMFPNKKQFTLSFLNKMFLLSELKALVLIIAMNNNNNSTSQLMGVCVLFLHGDNYIIVHVIVWTCMIMVTVCAWLVYTNTVCYNIMESVMLV